MKTTRALCTSRDSCTFFTAPSRIFSPPQGVPYRESLEADATGWPAVHVEVDFQSPLRFGDVFDVDVWVEKLGGKIRRLRLQR